MKLRALAFAGLCVIGGQAHAGLFNDDEARQQIKQVGERLTALEESGKQQAETARQQQAETDQQQTQTLLDLQSQIEAQNTDLRSLRGQNEDLVHSLQDAEKRQKDFYIDLDARIRHFETLEATPPAAPPVPVAQPDTASAADSTPALEADDITLGNRAYEAAHGLFKTSKHEDAISAFQEYLKKFPDAVYVPSAHFELGSAYFALKDYKNALVSFRELTDKYAFSPKTPDAMLGIADSQIELKALSSAQKTLKQIIAKYPDSDAANEAKKRLATLK